MTYSEIATVVLLCFQIFGACLLLYLHSATKNIEYPPAWVDHVRCFTGATYQRFALELLIFGAVAVIWFLSAGNKNTGATASFFLIDFSQGLILSGAAVRALILKWG